jgi:hypothetical protein
MNDDNAITAAAEQYLYAHPDDERPLSQVRSEMMAPHGCFDPDCSACAKDREVKPEWAVEQHPAFTFYGPSGNPATTDLSVVTRAGETPVVIATERDDNRGVSVTNGAEQLAAQVLIYLFPESMFLGEKDVPFRMVMHTRGETAQVGERDFSQEEPTFHEALFADFQVRDKGEGVQRIGDVVNWRNFDREISEALGQQKTEDRAEERTVSEAPASRRSLRR